MHFKIIHTTHYNGEKHRRTYSVIFFTIGYILSPLSWWNDMLVNIPLAYVFASGFSLLNHQLFLPTFVLGYWLTNVLGFILMHYGMVGFMNKPEPTIRLRHHLLIAGLYSLVILVFVELGWIPIPDVQNLISQGSPIGR